ncbi:hypothetical protein EJ02DRAFT_456951 [Clathrospora elynae]|uniref:Uncharacterized protein n=1 Tax=Clathrospora elynae TaxID=706981 RepID=A0A6A5SIL1_9PLEO|nr:hypothetical protein EJ02DRAFT_456951 [Clathrospora elynae]
MKFTIAITALLSAVPYLVQGIALPEASPEFSLSTGNETVPFTRTVDLLSKRADDEWLMVIYNNGKPEDQCGGVANNFNGKSNLCEGLGGVTGKICADLKVQANVGFASCEFNFKADGTSCGGDSLKKTTVDKGKDSNGVVIPDNVRFVSVTCS